MSTFTLSIETEEGKSHQHGFHLGTIESTARQLAEEQYHARVANDLPVVTVALIRDGRMFDCFMGDRWQNSGA